jgi:hypothetical protein
MREMNLNHAPYIYKNEHVFWHFRRLTSLILLGLKATLPSPRPHLNLSAPSYITPSGVA